METSVMNYRKIWEKSNGKNIPNGYEIHHKDGDKTNNDPSNLICVSIEEHLKIHEEQGDHGAVQAILMRMARDESMQQRIKQAASEHQKQLLAEGRHNFPKGEARSELSKKIMKERLSSGNNAFLGISDRRENSRNAGKRSAELKAGFLNTESDFHGGKLTKGTSWWINAQGSRKRSKDQPGPEWQKGMKYESKID
jgi:hypothetical protein